MSEFIDEIRSLRNRLAEHGREITFSDLVAVLDESSKDRALRDCRDCHTASAFGICFSCLLERVSGRARKRKDH